MAILRPGDRVRLTTLGESRMSPASRNPATGVVLGNALDFVVSKMFLRVEGVGANGKKHVGSYFPDSWEKDDSHG